MGRRGLKVVYGYSGGEWVQNKEIRFVYDGWNLVKETTISGSAASVDRYYVWGLDLSQSLQGAGGVGGLLTVIDGSLTYHYCFDANGNVGQVVNAADGTVDAHYEYGPFGKLVSQSGDYSGENFYRFSTKYFDGEVNLYYYGYRYYSPELGRWINRDPLGEEGGFNLYAFILNDSINYLDPFGLERKWYEKTVPQLSGEAKSYFGNLTDHYSRKTSNSLENYDFIGYTVNALNTIFYGLFAIALPENDEEFMFAVMTVEAGPAIANSAKYISAGTKGVYYKIFRKCGDDLIEVTDDVATKTVTELEKFASKSTTKLLPQTTPSELFKSMGSFEGKSMREIKSILEKNGFRYMGRTKGGYTKFYGPGSKKTRIEIQIRPDGEIIRYQHTPSKRIYRYDSQGNLIENHNSGEFVGGNFGGS